MAGYNVSYYLSRIKQNCVTKNSIGTFRPTNGNSNDLAKAEDLKQAAIDAERAYNLALSEARAEAQTIIEEAKAEIKQELLVATEKADVEISKKAAESEKAITEIRKGAIKAVEEVANDTAQAILGKVMPSLSNEATIKKAVSDRMKD